MAGKRQHYVPRFLQRGFLYNEDIAAERTWLHRHGAIPRPVAIGDIGVEDWFYSRKSVDGSKTLDDEITDFEQEIGPLVAALRNAPPGTTIEPSKASEMLLHLVTRTAHLRQLMTEGMLGMRRELEALFTDPSRLAAMLGFDGPVMGDTIMNAIADGARQLAPAGVPEAFSARLMAGIMRENGERIVAQAINLIGPLFVNLLNGLEDRIRDTHNQVLATPPETNKRLSALNTFNWHIEEARDLILPDAVALARTDDEALVAMLFADAENIRSVLMPVSESRILIGRNNHAEPENLEDFNARAAANCEAFFVAGRSFHEDGLADLIGTEARRALNDTINSAVEEASLSRAKAANEPSLASPQTFQLQEFSYELHLADFGDDILAKEFGSVFHGVVRALIKDIPLHDLHAVVIAADYDKALADIDLGDPNAEPLKSGALGYGLGVAMPVTVIRDGQQKSILVFAAGLAETWLSDDFATRAMGLHTLVKMLASVGHYSRYSHVRLIGFEPDAMFRELQGAIAQAPSHYWSARQAAFVDPDQGRTYSELVLDSFAFVEDSIATEHAAIIDDDIAPTMRCALAGLSAVLKHVADWIGHRDGLAEDEDFAGSDLPTLLQGRDLHQWIELFARDLAACYREDGSLDLDVIAGFHRHVERLLWSTGIYCWPDVEDMRCLVTEQPLRPSQLWS